MYGYHIPIEVLKVYLSKVQYRLDGDIEYHDPVEPSTTSCPFLPGQSINVLDVPVQFDPGEDHFREESTSSTGSTVYTMDPEAKYIGPVPSVRRKVRDPFLEASSKISRSFASKPSPLITARSLPAMFSAASNNIASLGNPSTELFQAYTSASLSSCSNTPLLVAFQKLRGTKSADRSDQQALKNRNGPLLNGEVRNLSMESLSEFGRNVGHTSDIGTKPVVSSRSPLRHTFRPQSIESEAEAGAYAAGYEAPVVSTAEAQIGSAAGKVHLPLEDVPTKGSGSNSYALVHELSSTPDSPYYTSLEQLREHKSFFEEIVADCWNQPLTTGAIDGPDPTSNDESSIHPALRHGREFVDVPSLPRHGTLSELRNNSFLPSETSFLDDGSDCGPYSQERSLASSDDIQEIFSPGLAASTIQTDAMSPCHLSQPISPLRSDFGEALSDLRNDHHSQTCSMNLAGDFDKLYLHPTCEPSSITQPTPQRSSGGFEGYSLREEEQSSVLTLRNLPASTSKSPSGESPFSHQGSQDLVHSWNDGSEHRLDNMTALDELVEDLGYLGEMIV